MIPIFLQWFFVAVLHVFIAVRGHGGPGSNHILAQRGNSGIIIIIIIIVTIIIVIIIIVIIVVDNIVFIPPACFFLFLLTRGVDLDNLLFPQITYIWQHLKSNNTLCASKNQTVCLK